MQPKIKILQLYPDELSVYGDDGNLLVLRQRLKWRGIDSEVVAYSISGVFPDQVDIILSGGGQDSNQVKVMGDLLSIKPKLEKLIDNGTPMLAVCGSYQLLGKYFLTADGKKIKGLGIIDAFTEAKAERLTGNVTAVSPQFGQIVGYGNHSGQTFLGKGAEPLARVIRGNGNNQDDETEGVIYKNLIATYLHGPILAKNPQIADWLITQAISNKTGQPAQLAPLDDTLERQAHHQTAHRPL